MTSSHLEEKALDANSPTLQKAFVFDNPRQQKIYERLHLIGPGPAKFYKDACAIMSMQPPLDSTTHLVSHLMREIESALRDVLEVFSNDDGQFGENEGHKASINAVLVGLEVEKDSHIATAWFKLADDRTLASHAHRRSLSNPRPLNDAFKSVWSTFQEIINEVLARFESQFHKTTDLLDTIIAKTSPSKSDVKFIREHIPHNEINYRYFFDALKNHEWLPILLGAGFFDDPPSIIQDEENGSFRFPFWPQSRFLMRQAESYSQIVAPIILNVPETDNERVHEDFVEAALKMPVKWARRIAEKELEWIRAQKQFYFLYPDYVGDLIVKLAEQNEVDLTLNLAAALLDVNKVEREIGSPGDEGYHKRVEVIAKFSTWEYKRVVEKVVPAIATASGLSTIRMFCGLLEKAIEMDLSEPNPPHDHSHIWLPAIEDHEQNRHADSDLKAILAIGIREASLQVLDGDRSVLLGLVAMLEANKWAVFKRVSLFLISQFAKDFPEKVAERLTDRELFKGDAYRHEYALLAQAGFGLIGDAEQQEILSWVEAEPSDEEVSEYKKWYLDQHGSEPSKEEVLAIEEKTKLNRLWQFRNNLPANWEEKYECWVQKHKEPKHPDFSYYSSGGWVGPTSPKSAEDLKQMSVSEIVGYLKTWEPPEGHFVETPEGLSRTLAQAVSDDPILFASDAVLFKGLDPTYVRGFIDGFRDVIKDKSDFPWKPLLELFQWAVEQTREFPEPKIMSMEKDPGWAWTRKSIAGLLSRGLSDGSGEIPFEFREQVWSLLAILTDDPDPADEEYGEGHMDPSTRAINTVRGEAMHAAVNYGLWVYRHSSEGEKSFDLMAELRTVLDQHLSSDTSLAIRSIYGQRFPWLHLMDSAWAEHNREKIFPSGSAAVWDAAWKTYITFCQPFDLMLEALRDQYALAIEKIGTSSAIDINIADAEQRLAEHLLVFYWRGKLELDDALVRAFYAKADVQLKARAMEFLGRSLRGAPEDISPEVQDRLKAFWEWRFAQAQDAGEPEELADFCWWFASGKMDVDWALAQLKVVLSLSIKLDALDFAAEELVKLVSDKPIEVLECLNLMIGHLGTEGIYFGWNDEAKQILGEAMVHQDQVVKSQAEDIIHRLGAMGYFEFRELLNV